MSCLYIMTQYVLEIESVSNSLLPSAGLEMSKQRLLSAQLPFLPPSITESEKIPYLSSCIPLDSVLMVSMIFVILEKCHCRVNE